MEQRAQSGLAPETAAKKVYVQPKITDLGNAVKKTLGGGNSETLEVIGGLPSGWE